MCEYYPQNATAMGTQIGVTARASRNPQIDNLAHVGGFLAGLGAMLLLDAAPARNRGLANAALAAPFLAGIVLTIVGIGGYPVGSGLTCVGA
jgi:hypothetical protein